MKILNSIVLNLIIWASLSQAQWIENETASQNRITDVVFINSNTGFASTARQNSGATENRLMKTTNKGLNWTSVYNFNLSSNNTSIDFINENTGYYVTYAKVYKTVNGGSNWSEQFQFPQDNSYPRIRFGDANTGYVAFSKLYQGYGTGGIYLYKTTNGGTNWDLTAIDNFYINVDSRISDISISKSDPLRVSVCGYQKTNGRFNSILYNSENGFSVSDNSEFSVDFARFDRIAISPVNNDVFILSNKGIFKGETNIIPLNEGDANEQVGISIDINGKGYAITRSSKIYMTSNNGANWSLETTYTGSQFSDSRVINFNDIVYSGTVNGKIVTKTLSSNFQTYFDNQSTPGTIFFDGNQYASPSTSYLRGGTSTVISDLPLIINPNQSNEKIFYKWSD